MVECWANFRFMQKLKYVKENFRKWNLDVFGDVQVRKKDLILEIDNIDTKELEGQVSEELLARRAVAH